MQKIIVFILSCSIVVFFTFYLLILYSGNNPVNSNLNTRVTVTSLIPEGWAFFTKNSTDPRLYLYSVEGKKITSINLLNISPEYIFGISRKNRLLNVQAATLLKESIDDTIKVYKFRTNNIDSILEKIDLDTLVFDELKLSVKKIPNLEGRLVLVQKLMLPWTLLSKSRNFPTLHLLFPIYVKHI